MQDLLLIALLIVVGIAINWNYYFEKPEVEELDNELLITPIHALDALEPIPNSSNFAFEQYTEEVIPATKQTSETLSAVVV